MKSFIEFRGILLRKMTCSKMSSKKRKFRKVPQQESLMCQIFIWQFFISYFKLTVFL